MIKRILVPTDGSESARRAALYAVALGARLGASLEAVHVVDVKLLEGPLVRDITTAMGATPFVTPPGNIAALLEERGRAALEWFGGECVRAGLPCETGISIGIVPRIIAEKARLSDLIVMGRGGEHSAWLEGFLGSTTQAVVRRSPVPVLVTGTDTPVFEDMLVAYDGSPLAKRALRAGAGVACEWNMRLHLLVVAAAPERLLGEAREYLEARPVRVEYTGVSGDPGEAIVAHAEKCAAGIVVMGAFGHTKLREMMLGSTTVYTLNKAPCPVLLIR